MQFMYSGEFNPIYKLESFLSRAEMFSVVNRPGDGFQSSYDVIVSLTVLSPSKEVYHALKWL